MTFSVFSQVEACVLSCVRGASFLTFMGWFCLGPRVADEVAEFELFAFPVPNMYLSAGADHRKSREDEV